MGELIYCRQPIAANPFFIDEASVNVYSLEELSYYIHHNPYLLNQTFMSADLCHWIERELNEKELGRELLTLLSENVPLSVFIGKILTFTGYLTTSEIKNTVDIITSFEDKSEGECKKMRGDRLMEKDRIVDSIYEYETILEDPSDLSAEMLGNVYHNLGVCYCKLFFFEQAVECFEKAFELNKNNESLRSMFAAIRCEKNEPLYDRMVMKYHIPKEIAEKLKEEATAASNCDEIKMYGDKLDHLRADYSEEDAFLSELSFEIKKLTEDYNQMSRI